MNNFLENFFISYEIVSVVDVLDYDYFYVRIRPNYLLPFECLSSIPPHTHTPDH